MKLINAFNEEINDGQFAQMTIYLCLLDYHHL